MNNKQYCIACGFPKINWRDYECPLCNCPQHFIFGLRYDNRYRRFLESVIVYFKVHYFWLITWRSLKNRYKERAWLKIEGIPPNIKFIWPK